MKRKLCALLLAIGLLMSAAACNASQNNAAKESAPLSSAASVDTSATDQPSVQPSETGPEKEETVDLDYWTADSKVTQSIKDFVASVTDETSDSYVPPAERVAVFDSDGTLYGELFPTYIDQCLMIHRLVHDDTYQGNAEDKAYCEALEKALLTGEKAPKAPRSSGYILADAFKGMTVEEYRAYFRDFLAQPAVGFEGMTYAQGYYKPMVALVRYLAANDFQVFVVSGAETNLLRELSKDTLGEWIPPYRVVGTQFSLTAPGQGETPARDYTYQPDDKVIFGGDMTFKNLKMNKVVSIVNYIGVAPILAFGNSSGDLAMGEYTVQHGGKAYMLLCDDTDRDYGKLDVAASFAEDCQKLGFETVSMKNDFTTIYGDNVIKTKIEAPAETSVVPAA